MGKKIIVISEDAALSALRNLTVVAMGAVFHEINAPVSVRSGRGREPQLDVSWPEDFDLMSIKEDFRAALWKRDYDIMFKRRVMRILFATSVEEP